MQGFKINYFIYFFALLVLCCNCDNKSQTNTQIADKEKLAKSYCSSCHEFTPPGLLPKNVWKKEVLPVMANFMNVRYKGDSSFSMPDWMTHIDSAILPPKVKIPIEDFRKIDSFYVSMAPDKLPLQNREGISGFIDLFAIKTPNEKKLNSFTTAVTIDPKQHLIFHADGANKLINVFDEDLNLIEQRITNNITTNIKVKGYEIILTNIGSFKPDPSKKTGNLMAMTNKQNKTKVKSKVLLENLDRSVDAINVDLDNDGKSDWLVCEFGFLRGDFSWYKNDGNGEYKKKVIKPVPGAIKAYVEDVNKDGKPDIWVLFGQANEGISIFTNRGNGQFEERKVITFPPVYGSNDFEFADMNSDGAMDIIYSCGDNADYSQVLKNYHGVYIFINDGINNFKRKYFFPMYGCYKAMANDFDNDGDLDIACISYFADYDNYPQESFIYLKNMGTLQFSPQIIDGLPKGRWVCMDADDLDGDGDIDMVLGNLAAPYKNRPDLQNIWLQEPSFIVLQNKLNKKIDGSNRVN